MKSPRYNCYVCEHHCQTFTVDVDHGVTPFMIGCEFKGSPDRPANPKFIGANGKCIGTAKSCFYPRDKLPDHAKVTHEWYRPNSTEFKRLSHGSKEHVSKGGLLLRERTDKEPVYHEDESEPIMGPTTDIEIREGVAWLNNRKGFGKKYF